MSGKAEAYKAEIEEKIQRLLQEYADSEISSEQFEILYDRYHAQLEFAEDVIAGRIDRPFSPPETGPSTLAVRRATMGKPQGVALFHYRSREVFHLLGEFDIDNALMMPILNAFAMQSETPQHLEPYVQKITGHWVVFVHGQHSTVIVEFDHEPAGVQTRKIQHLHEDFEQLNGSVLATKTVDIDALVLPFVVLVHRE